LELAQRDASGGVFSIWALVSGKQQSPARRAVGARKTFQLLVETLEAQAEAERAAIFEEEAANLFNMFGESGLNQIDLAPIAARLIRVTQIVLIPVALAVSRGRHRKTSLLHPELPVDFIPLPVDCAGRAVRLRFLHSRV